MKCDIAVMKGDIAVMKADISELTSRTSALEEGQKTIINLLGDQMERTARLETLAHSHN